MTFVGGIPVAPDEYGRCVTCWGWGRGPWVADLTAQIALVLHCQPTQPNTPQGQALAPGPSGLPPPNPTSE